MVRSCGKCGLRRELFLLVLPLLLVVSAAQAGWILPSLEKKLEKLGPNEKVRVIVHLKEKADLSLTPFSDKAVRLSFLKRFASEKQAPVMAFVRSLGNRVSDTLSFWIFNGFAANATKDAVYADTAHQVGKRSLGKCS